MISFFEDGNYAEGIDYSYTPETHEETEEGTWHIPATGRKDCIFVSELDIPAGKIPVLTKSTDGVYLVEFEDKPEQAFEKPPVSKKERVFESIISSESIKNIDLEGEEFTDFEIGEIITARVFGGNPHAQTGLLRKVAKIQNAQIAGEKVTKEMQGVLDYANQKDAEIDEIINLFYKK